MARGDFYASPFGIAYSAYIERPRLTRAISRVVWGGNSTPYYKSMEIVGSVPKDGAIVDCPCGPGTAFRALDPNAQVRYVGVDLSPSMLRRARKRARARRLESIELHMADATEVPVASSSADLFLSYWGLHCFDDPKAALAEAARVLRLGGRLVGSCFVRGVDSRRQRLLVRPGTGDFGKIVGTQSEVEAWMEAAELEPIGVERSGPMMFFQARARAA